MPLIQIHMLPGRTDDEKRAVLTAIHEAVTSTLGVPDTAVRAWLTERDPPECAPAAEKRAVLTAIHEAVTSTLGVPDTAVRAWITEMDPHGFIRAGEIAADQLAAK